MHSSHINPVESVSHNHVLGPIKPRLWHYHTNHGANLAANACSSL